MPGRLLLAAEIVLDVARSLPPDQRAVLESAAEDLKAAAASISAGTATPLDLSTALETLHPSVRRLASALVPEIDHRFDPPSH